MTVDRMVMLALMGYCA